MHVTCISRFRGRESLVLWIHLCCLLCPHFRNITILSYISRILMGGWLGSWKTGRPYHLSCPNPDIVFSTSGIVLVGELEFE